MTRTDAAYMLGYLFLSGMFLTAVFVAGVETLITWLDSSWDADPKSVYRVYRDHEGWKVKRDFDGSFERGPDEN